MKKLISLINQYSWGKQLVNLKVGQKNTPTETQRGKSRLKSMIGISKNLGTISDGLTYV